MDELGAMVLVAMCWLAVLTVLLVLLSKRRRRR